MNACDLKSPSRPRVLVVGYGNELRGDDGLGPAVAARVETQAWPGVRVVICHQLTPELAAAMAGADRVIFVDADENHDGPGVRVRELTAAPPTGAMTHVFGPRDLLELTRLAYDWCPAAWWVTIPGVCFALGSTLSPETRLEIESAVAAVRRLSLIPEVDLAGRID